MINNNVSVSVLINGQSGDFIAREYTSPMDQQTYIEGRENSKFSLRIENKNDFRVLAIPSVDGLSILDGKPAGENSKGFILSAKQSLDVPGWMVDGNTAAKFFFSGLRANGEDGSYAAQIGQDTSNKGVIGLMVYRDRVISNPSLNLRSASPRRIQQGFEKKGMAPTGYGALYCPNSHSAAGSMATMASSSMLQDFDEPAGLGTGFGEATKFSTKEDTFNRGDLICLMVMYYDDARGLKKRGIDVSQPETKRPNPFPTMNTGCPVPNGWSR